MSQRNPTRWLTGLVCAALLAGCSDGGGDSLTPVERGNRDQVLHLGNGDEPSGVDPHITAGMSAFHIQKALFEGLTSRDPKTLEPVPGVAERWEISEDRREYIFHLRDDARWSNGDPVTAQDFVWSWQRALIPALGNPYAYALFVIEGAEAYHKGEIDDFSRVGVTAVDDKTLKVTLEDPTAYFLQLLDHHSTYPVHKETVLAHGDMEERGTDWTRPAHFVGNGPFTIKSWEPNRVFVVEKNTGYWDSDTVTLNEIHFHAVREPSAEDRLFRAGQLHVTYEVPASKVVAYERDGNPALHNTPFYGTYFYLLNTEREPLDDVRVRKALAYSIDRQAITDSVTRSGEEPAHALTPPRQLGYSPEAGVPYDPERARELLAEAGYPGGEGMRELELMYNTMESHKQVALAVQQMWRQELGINVTLRNQEWKVFLESKRIGDFDIGRMGWIGDYLDPSTFLELMLSDSGNNDSGWGNERYDRLLEKASRTDNQEQRHDYFQQAEAILVDEVPVIPLYTYTRTRLVHPAVQGWEDNILDYQSYKHLSLEPQNDSGAE